jgi:uracil-DNA glycosylase
MGVVMSNNKLAKLLIDTLPSGLPTLFNPWRDHCTDDEPCNGPDAKLARLAAHLDCDPEFVLCGEAPGYLGCRHSGIAFTSERLLLHGKIPRISPMSHRLTSRALPYSEPSATIVWKALYNLGIEKRTILWNALQMHPHRPGNKQSNRTPTSAEIANGKPALQMLISAFPSAKVVAVGKKAEGLLNSMGVVPAATVRHPANGGATAFSRGLELLVGGAPGRTAVEQSLFDYRPKRTR